MRDFASQGLWPFSDDMFNFMGKNIIGSMLYASTQPEGELLSNRNGTRTTKHIHVRSDNAELELSHILHVVQKSVEFSGTFVADHHYKHVLTAPARCSQIQNLSCTWCFARLYYNSRGRWTVGRTPLIRAPIGFYAEGTCFQSSIWRWSGNILDIRNISIDC